MPVKTEPGNGRSAEWQQRDCVWHSDLPSREKMILLAFIEFDRLARGRELFPSIDRIAWQTGFANSTVREAVRVLEQRGILQRIGYVASRYAVRGRVSKYHFHPDRLSPRPEWTPDSRREPAPVTPDSRREPAPVRLGQPPNQHSTGAGSRVTVADSPLDRRRTSTRQAPGAGGDRTYERTNEEDQSERGTEERTSRAARVSASDPDAAHQNHDDDEQNDDDVEARFVEARKGGRPHALAYDGLPPPRILELLAHETFDALGDDASFNALADDFLERTRGLDMNPEQNIGLILFSVKKERRARRAGATGANGAGVPTVSRPCR